MVLIRCLVCLVLLASVACRQPKGEPIFTATVIEGQQFAHRIAFPTAFYESKSLRDGWFGPLSFVMARNDQHWFRISPNSPDELLVAACDIDSIKFSENSFGVDTARGFSVRPTTWGDWKHGIEIRDLKAIAQAGDDVRDVPTGYEYHGRTFPIRGDLIEGKWFATTADGALVVVAGGIRPSDASKYMLDVYDGATGHRLAAVDVAYKGRFPLEYALLDAHLINTRWVAITLDTEFKQMLLLDFKSPQEGQAQ
jgi:hypothetical protein